MNNLKVFPNQPAGISLLKKKNQNAKHFLAATSITVKLFESLSRIKTNFTLRCCSSS